jgi:predicted metal-binding protein
MFHRCPGVDQAIMSAPELFPCPHCDQELEIWKDERKGTCTACEKRVARQEAMAYAVKMSQRRIQSVRGDAVTMAVCEAVESSGEVFYYERYEAVVPLSAIDHHSKYKAACKACDQHGINLACPPFSPTFPHHTEGTESARVICLRLPLEYFSGELLQDSYRLCFQKVRGFLVDELSTSRKAGYTIAGAGHCVACERCAAEEGLSECSKPHERIFSLESLGVNLMELAKRSFGINLEWSSESHTAHFVCAMGAVFFQGDAT